MSLKAKLFQLAALMIAISAHVNVARATTLSFDDLPNGQLLANYGSLIWSDYYAANASFDGIPVVSAPNVIYNGYGTPASFAAATTGSTFTLNSAYLSNWPGYNGDGVVSVVAKDASGNIVDSTYLQLTNQFEFFDFEWANVYSVTIQNASSGTWHLIDNLTINDARAVPEPAAVVLLGMASAGLGLVRRRKIT